MKRLMFVVLAIIVFVGALALTGCVGDVAQAESADVTNVSVAPAPAPVSNVTLRNCWVNVTGEAIPDGVYSAGTRNGKDYVFDLGGWTEVSTHFECMVVGQ